MGAGRGLSHILARDVNQFISITNGLLPYPLQEQEEGVRRKQAGALPKRPPHETLAGKY